MTPDTSANRGPSAHEMVPTSAPVVVEIRTLHSELTGFARKSLQLAIRIGELLSQQKRTVGHGNWGRWITENLPFTERSASNYMRLYESRDRLKSENVSDLSVAYEVLAGSSHMSRAEAEECTERLSSSLTSILDSMERDLELRESQGYRPEFETFEDFLVRGRSITVETFEKRLRWCCDYLNARPGTGEVAAVLMRLMDGELESIGNSGEAANI